MDSVVLQQDASAYGIITANVVSKNILQSDNDSGAGNAGVSGRAEGTSSGGVVKSRSSNAKQTAATSISKENMSEDTEDPLAAIVSYMEQAKAASRVFVQQCTETKGDNKDTKHISHLAIAAYRDLLEALHRQQKFVRLVKKRQLATEGKTETTKGSGKSKKKRRKSMTIRTRATLAQHQHKQELQVADEPSAAAGPGVGGQQKEATQTPEAPLAVDTSHGMSPS